MSDKIYDVQNGEPVLRSPTSRELAPAQCSPAHVAKGDKHGECNRTVCRNPNALWFNKSTRKYYCQPCAFKIMSWPENAGLLVKEAPENEQADTPRKEK